MRYDRPVTGANYGGYYVGPNLGTLFPATGNPGQGKTVTMFCVDFLNEVTFNQMWTANVSPLAGSSLALTREPTGIAGYRKAAWLADQFAVQAPQYWGGIQSAIWGIFGAPGFDGNPVKTGQQQPVATDARNAVYWTTLANGFAASGAYATYDYSRWAVITGTGAAGAAGGRRPAGVPRPDPSRARAGDAGAARGRNRWSGARRAAPVPELTGRQVIGPGMPHPGREIRR